VFRKSQVWIVALVDESMPEELRGQMENYANARRLIILFDGMDEMPRAAYGRYVRALSNFGTIWSEMIKLLYSCRINDFSPEFIHQHLVLLPFDDRTVLSFLESRLDSPVDSAVPTHTVIDGISYTTEQIHHRLCLDRPTLQIGNPQVLTLIVRYLRSKHTWPRSRRELFDNYFETNYERFKSTEAARKPMPGKPKRAYPGIDEGAGTMGPRRLFRHSAQ
jgi:hypothetical protein